MCIKEKTPKPETSFWPSTGHYDRPGVVALLCRKKLRSAEACHAFCRFCVMSLMWGQRLTWRAISAIDVNKILLTFSKLHNALCK